jgi:hypothetical protein
LFSISSEVKKVSIKERCAKILKKGCPLEELLTIKKTHENCNETERSEVNEHDLGS